MAVETVNALDELTSPAANDEIGIWDVSAGQYMRIQRATLLGGTITGGGTVATGGFTLTAPESGVVALVNAEQTFTAKPTLAAGIGIKYLVMPQGQTRPLSDWTEQTGGLVILHDADGANAALFVVQSGANGTIEMLDPANQFSDIIGVGYSVNFSYDTGAYRIRNNQPQARTVGVLVIGG